MAKLREGQIEIQRKNRWDGICLLVRFTYQETLEESSSQAQTTW